MAHILLVSYPVVGCCLFVPCHSLSGTRSQFSIFIEILFYSCLDYSRGFSAETWRGVVNSICIHVGQVGFEPTCHQITLSTRYQREAIQPVEG